MATKAPTIARIRLARSRPRLFVLPLLLVLAGVALAAAAVVGPPRAGEPAWYALVVAGAVTALAGVGLGTWLASIGLDVEEAAVRVRWLGGDRRYSLAPGPVTRVRVRGDDASKLRVRRGWLGWGLGPAVLRGEERIEVVRLAATPTLILVPTEGGRLAIAAESEDDLIGALSLAARARQRTEELALSEPPFAEPSDDESGIEDAAAALESAEPEPHVLTGIERALLEDRLAREREEASAALVAPIDQPVPPDEPEAALLPEGGDEPEPERDARRGRWRVGRGESEHVGPARGLIGRPRPSAAFVLVPLVGAGIVWGAAMMLDRLPEPTSDLGRLTSLALVLAGPATSVGAIMARAWWPRIVGVVVTSGLAAAVFIGRALLG